MFSNFFNILKCVGFKLLFIIETILFVIIFLTSYLLLGAIYFILTLLSCGEFCANMTNEDEEKCCNIEFLNDWSSRINLLYEQKFCNWNWNCNWNCNTVELSSVIVHPEVISVQPSREDEAAPHYLEEQHENSPPSYTDMPPAYPSIEANTRIFVNLSNHKFCNLEYES
jgi:hypothetical protein